MKLEQIKDFIDYLVALDAFDVDANLGVQLDKAGDVEGTQININFRYPQQFPIVDEADEPTEEETGVEAPTDAEFIRAAVSKMFDTVEKKQCCKEDKEGCCKHKCSTDKIKTGFHSFPGGFAIHSVSCGEAEPDRSEEGPTEEDMFEEIMRDFPAAIARLKRKYGDH